MSLLDFLVANINEDIHDDVDKEQNNTESEEND